MKSIRSASLFGWCLVATLAACSSIYGQSRQPAPPKEYEVQIRFRIRAALTQWLDRFEEMNTYLREQQFVRAARPADEPEDIDADTISGLVPSDTARKLLLHPSVESILLMPRGYKLPAGPDRVKVQMEIIDRHLHDRQKVLHDQCVERLTLLGFHESVGYDHRSYTRILGTMPASDVPTLLRDLRTLPSGWLVPQTPIAALPTPLRNSSPIRVIEVLPAPDGMPPLPEPAAAPVGADEQHLLKLSPEVRALSTEKDPTKTVRLEAILTRSPDDEDRTWELSIKQAAVGAVIEGRIGTVVTLNVRNVQIADLAKIDVISAVRLPRSGEILRRPNEGGVLPNILAITGVDKLHRLGYRGRGVKIAIIDGDFAGYEPLVGKQLPAGTQLVDFTAMRNSSILPDPMPSGQAMGQGTQCALAVALAAPEAELLLLRVDPSAAHQVLSIAKMLNEEPAPFALLQLRAQELTRDREALERRRSDLLAERKKAMEGLVFEEGETILPEHKKRFEESHARLKKVRQDLEELTKVERELDQRIERFLKQEGQLALVKKVRVVVCSLVWNTGHPLDGGSALSRYLDDRPFVGTSGDRSKSRIASLRKNRYTLWFQPTGDVRGQAWTGRFRDADANGVMEFAGPTDPLRKERWTSELNFLGWQVADGRQSPELPRGRIRLTVQWREPHDPDLFDSHNDPYRMPLVNLRLVILAQRDPTGQKIGSDDLDVIATSSTPPVRLQNLPTSGTYEQSIEFTLPADTRVALRIEGKVPASIRPAGEPTLPGQNRSFEMKSRIFVEALGTETNVWGRPVFLDYTDNASWPQSTAADASEARAEFGSVGMPADARTAITVGAAKADGKLQPYTAVGAGAGLDLLVKPDLLMFDQLALPAGPKDAGSRLSASYAAGMAALLLQQNAPAEPHLFLKLLDLGPGDFFRIPPIWFDALPIR